MKGRETTVQKFSTFLECHQGCTRYRWKSTLKLAGNMNQLVRQDPDGGEEFWAQRFLKALRPLSVSDSREARLDKIASSFKKTFISHQATEENLLYPGEHLSAYLQEPGFRAAQTIYQKLAYLGGKYPLEDLFQIANCAISNPARLLRNFQMERSFSTIRSYAKEALRRIVANYLYEHDLSAKASKLSDYGLLRSLSKKELEEALLASGFLQPELNLNSLVMQCFKEVYQPQNSQGKSLEAPNLEQLQAMAKLYNQQVNRLNLVGKPAKAEDIQKRLTNCIQAARKYRKPKILSLDAKPPYDDSKNEMQLEAFSADPWEQLEESESEWHQIQEMIAMVFQELPIQGQVLMKLYYGLGIKQNVLSEVMGEIDSKLNRQDKVSKQLKKYEQKILHKFADRWNQKNPDSPIRDREIEQLRKPMEENLKKHCKALLNTLLQDVSLRNGDCTLREAFQREVERELGFPIQLLDKAEEALNSFVGCQTQKPVIFI